MKNTLLPIALAALAFSASSAFADNESRNVGSPEAVRIHADRSIHTKLAVEPKNAGGSKVRPDGTANDIGARNSDGTATTTTTTSQSMSNRVPVDHTSDHTTYANTDNGPSGMAIFLIILLIGVVTAFGIRTYRSRELRQ
jgi:hypothetical protein